MGQKKILSLVVIILVACAVLFFTLPNEEITIIDESQEVEGSPTMVTSNSNVQEVVTNELLRDLANPRVRIRNASGYEVIGLDHDGTISGISLTIDNNATISGTGFFDIIGSLGSKISKIWTTDVEASGVVNFTGNITVDECILGGNGATICFVEG